MGDRVIASSESRSFQSSCPHCGQSESPASLVCSGANAPQTGHRYGSPSGVREAMDIGGDSRWDRVAGWSILGFGPIHSAERRQPMSTATVPCYTAAEYLAFERRSTDRHEFFKGEIFAMSGGSRYHSRITANLARELGNALADSPCAVNSGDLRIACPTGLFTYPDLSVDCGEPKLLDGVKDTLLNPVLIVEVFSPSTERYDRTIKFDHYRTIPSLREYVLVSQDSPRVEHYARQQDADHWLLTTINDPQGVVPFPALDCAIPMAEIFAKVEFSPEPPIHDDGSGVRRPDR
jgi:Uma2 family endonuclease